LEVNSDQESECLIPSDEQDRLRAFLLRRIPKLKIKDAETYNIHIMIEEISDQLTESKLIFIYQQSDLSRLNSNRG
jgi:hypothetical protein